MPSDALFERLADALSRPSKAYLTAQEGIKALESAGEGYLRGQEIGDAFRQRRLKQQTFASALGGLSVEEGLMNLTGESGAIQQPNLAAYVALQRAKQAGIPKPSTSYNPAQLDAIFSRDPKRLSAAFGGEVPASAVSPAVAMRGQSLQDERGRANLNLRGQGQAMAFGKSFDKDPDVVRAFTERNQSQRAKQVLAAGNPVGDASIRVIAARAAGEVGNLAQNEQQVFGGSPAFTDWLNRSVTRIATGKLDETDRQYLQQLFDVYSAYGDSRIKQRKLYHATRYSNVANIPLEEAEANLGDISQLGVADEPQDGIPPGAIPSIGGTFNGAKVLHVEKVE